MPLPVEELGRWVDEDGKLKSHADILLYGPTGAGKTYLASTIVSNPKDLYVLAADPTGHKGIPFKVDGKRIQSSNDVRAIYEELYKGGHGYKAILFDGLSFYHDIVLKEMGQYYHDKKGASDPDLMPQQGRIKVIASLANTYRAFIDLTQLTKSDGSPDYDRRMHVVFTTLDERIKEDDAADFMVRPLLGTKKINDKMPSFFSVQGFVAPIGGVDKEGKAILDRKVLFTTMGGYQAKDRLGIFPGICNPMPPLHTFLNI